MKKLIAMILATVTILSASIIPAHAAMASPTLIPIYEHYTADTGKTITSIERFGDSLEFNFNEFAANVLGASEATEQTAEGEKTFSAFKVITERDNGERVEFSTFRYGESDFYVDLTYNKVLNKTVLAVAYQNVYLVAEQNLEDETVETLVRDQRIGMVVPEAMLRATVQAAYDGTLTGVIRAFTNNGLDLEAFVFEGNLVPSAFDLSEAKG